MPSPIFQLVAEGRTDIVVLRSLLAGLFNDPNIEVRSLQPDPNAASDRSGGFGGWQEVLNYLASDRLTKALPFADFLIIQIDTDICEEYGVLKLESGQMLAPHVLIERISEKLRGQMGPEVWERYSEHFIFAIPVDSIECWLLAVWGDANRRNQTQNCLDHLQRSLRKKNEKPLGDKDRRDYERVAKPFRKSGDLIKYRRNESLNLFLTSVEAKVAALSEKLVNTP